MGNHKVAGRCLSLLYLPGNIYCALDEFGANWNNNSKESVLLTWSKCHDAGMVVCRSAVLEMEKYCEMVPSMLWQWVMELVWGIGSEPRQLPTRSVKDHRSVFGVTCLPFSPIPLTAYFEVEGRSVSNVLGF